MLKQFCSLYIKFLAVCKYPVNPLTPFCFCSRFDCRDFANGVLGLAWVGLPPGSMKGGICDSDATLSVGQRSVNTAIVSFLNYGSLQPRAVTMVTIAHELGHNFGSQVRFAYFWCGKLNVIRCH